MTKNATVSEITKHPRTYIASTATHTFTFERARAGSRKLVATSFRIAVREADSLIPLRSAPLAMRKAARAHLGIA